MEMTRKQFEAIESELFEFKNKVRRLENELRGASIVGWEKTEDETMIGEHLLVSANHEDWEASKSECNSNREEPLFISIEGRGTTCSLHLAEMKQLRQYLEEKIEYLEAE